MSNIDSIRLRVAAEGSGQPKKKAKKPETVEVVDQGPTLTPRWKRESEFYRKDAKKPQAEKKRPERRPSSQHP